MTTPRMSETSSDSNSSHASSPSCIVDVSVDVACGVEEAYTMWLEHVWLGGGGFGTPAIVDEGDVQNYRLGCIRRFDKQAVRNWRCERTRTRERGERPVGNQTHMCTSPLSLSVCLCLYVCLPLCAFLPAPLIPLRLCFDRLRLSSFFFPCRVAGGIQEKIEGVKPHDSISYRVVSGPLPARSHTATVYFRQKQTNVSRVKGPT